MCAPKAVVLLSGGLDSATSAAQAIADGYEVIALSLRYGQRHDCELIAAKRVAQYLGIKEHFVVDVNLAQWGGSALTDQTVDIPTDSVQFGVIPITYVPGRNTVFLAVTLIHPLSNRLSTILLEGVTWATYQALLQELAITVLRCLPTIRECWKLSCHRICTTSLIES